MDDVKGHRCIISAFTFKLFKLWWCNNKPTGAGLVMLRLRKRTVAQFSEAIRACPTTPFGPAAAVSIAVFRMCYI